MTPGAPSGWGDGSRLEQASAWRLRIEADENLAVSEDFQTWLSESQNREIYGRVCATWDSLDDHLAAPQFLAVRRDTLSRARRAARGHLPDRRQLFAAAMLGIAMAAGIGALRYWIWPSDYATGIGERRVVVLEDGSRVSLDSNSEVRVHYTKAVRQLVLEHGRARFDVVHNIGRPFTVTAGDETVVAVGTTFDVEKLGDKVLVTLIEGRVLVRTEAGPVMASHGGPAPARTTALAAGQELIALADRKPVLQPTNIAVATAWESGRLVFNSEPLAEVVERINRYTDKPLLVDPDVAGVKVSGVFNAGDINSFVDAITNYFPIQAGIGNDGQTLLQKRS